jgi:hypothetical protein
VSDNLKDISKHKLGHMLSVPCVPFMPVSAQVSKWGQIHVRLMDGQPEYLTGHVRASVPPKDAPAVIAAITACPKEPSWSGSGSEYYTLTVKPADNALSCELYAGTVRVCTIVINPNAIIWDDKPEGAPENTVN